MWANCRRTANTRGEQESNGRTKADRGEEGLTWPNARRQDARRERQAQDRDKTQPEEDREDREASTVADRPDRNEGGEQQAEEKKKATPAPE